MSAINQKQYYLAVTPFFPTPDSFRGPFVYDQVEAIKRNSDYEVLVFTPTSRGDKRNFYIYNGCKVFLFPTRQTPSNLFTGVFDSYNCNQFLKALRRNNIDLDKIKFIHCHTMPFGCYGLSLKDINPDIKVVIQHHSRDPFSILYGKFGGWKPNLKYKTYHSIEIAEKADLHLSVSKLTEENLINFPYASNLEDYIPYQHRIQTIQKFLKGSPKIQNSYVLYNGVDTNCFKIENRTDLAASHDIRIGCIANFQALKDQISLIKAVELLKKSNINPKLVLIGSGPLLDNCSQYVINNKLDNNICFQSEVDHSKLPEFYNSLDLFVLPSVYEGFGCVYTEAYACGTPFMLCENQGATEYIPETDYKYWVFKKHSPEDIASKIKLFIKERPTQSLKYPFDIDTLIKAYLNYIAKL